MHKHAPPFPLFSQRLRHLRQTMGIKQLTLALDLGVDQTTISRWESGLQAPEPDVQQQALAALSCARKDDAALRRLVENATNHVHLVEEATHICLAYRRLGAYFMRGKTRARNTHIHPPFYFSIPSVVRRPWHRRAIRKNRSPVFRIPSPFSRYRLRNRLVTFCC